MYEESRNTNPIEELLNWVEAEFVEVEDIQSAMQFVRADPAPRTWPEVSNKFQMLPSNVVEEKDLLSCFLQLVTYWIM